MPYPENLTTGNSSHPHLQREAPPSGKIVRNNRIDIDAEKFKKLITVLRAFDHLEQSDFVKFIEMMEKCRFEMQPNLGLSNSARAEFEDNQPITVRFYNTEQTASAQSICYNSTENKNEEFWLRRAQERAVKTNSRSKPAKVKLSIESDQPNCLELHFSTKFREFVIKIGSNGHIKSTMQLHWDAIYQDLVPTGSIEEKSLRSFTPWQRHSECNFFNGRATNNVLKSFVANFPDCFAYNPIAYCMDAKSEQIHVLSDAKLIQTDSANLMLKFGGDWVQPPEGFSEVREARKPILAIVHCKSPLLGDMFQFAPACYRDGQLQIALGGHQFETQIVEVFHADFENQRLVPWEFTRRLPLVQSKIKLESGASYQDLHLLSANHDLLPHISAAPMVRGSDPASRQYWLRNFMNCTVYSEMSTIADIFNVIPATAGTTDIENMLYSSTGESSFQRLRFSRYELEQAKKVVFQVAIPHTFSREEDYDFFWGKDGEHIGRTTSLGYQALLKLVPIELRHNIRFGINMCCPAANMEQKGAGFGLRLRPEFISKIVAALKYAEDLECIPEIELKTLMLSPGDRLANDEVEQLASAWQMSGSHVPVEDPKDISVLQNQRMTEVVCRASADRFVYQAKSRDLEQYDLAKTTNVMTAAKVKSGFKVGFSGMVATLNDAQLQAIGLSGPGQPHFSVEGVYSHVKEQYEVARKPMPEDFEVMLGRVLLGSSWLLMGRHASDSEIMMFALLQAFLAQEAAVGQGAYGVDLFQIQMLYNVRHLVNKEKRDQVMDKILNAQSTEQMIDVLYNEYLTMEHVNHFGSKILGRLKNTVESVRPEREVVSVKEIKFANLARKALKFREMQA